MAWTKVDEIRVPWARLDYTRPQWTKQGYSGLDKTIEDKTRP